MRLQLICEAPPTGPGVEFGLQDKGGRLEPGVAQPDGALLFRADVQVVLAPDGGVQLRGPIVHGRPTTQFLYLSCRRSGSPGASWLFRLKVPLVGIDPAADAVEARIRATGGGSVPLLGGGWTRV
jgi:hypothetical protein